PVGTLAYGSYNAFQYWAIRKKAFRTIFQTRLLQAGGGVGSLLGLGVLGLAPLGLIVGYVVSGAAGFLRLGLSFLRDVQEVGGTSRAALLATLRNFRRFPTYSVVEALANSSAMMLPVILIAASLPG